VPCIKLGQVVPEHEESMNFDLPLADISTDIWDTKYRYRDGDVIRDASLEDTWQRVARALAAVEAGQEGVWTARFHEVLANFRFLPGGRIQAGAGTRHRTTLFNCFVMGTIEDTLDGIFSALKEGALTMQAGGGVGYDFSTLRPRGARADASDTIASGPVSFMHIWDSMCATLISTGARRGAMMATLRCDHPDILEFVEAKRDPAVLRHFNLSVLVSDAFMAALDQDADWPLSFPPGRTVGSVRARVLWERIMRANYDSAEPGVIFIDRVNRLNNLGYEETIRATNPCGEIPLPPYGACDLGSINLTRFVRAPFTPDATLDLDGIAATASVAVRMLDNVYELAHFPVPRQREVARRSRRLGLGITGLGDALAMLGLRYGSDASLDAARAAMAAICHAAYRASAELARERGPFPAYRAESYLAGEFVRSLPEDIRAAIAAHGIRNSHLTAIAPAGTISLLANNISSGLEPIYAYRYQHNVRRPDGGLTEYVVEDYAWRLYRSLHGDAPLPPGFVSATEIPPDQHLQMQAALQAHVDNSISKTINVPADMAFSGFEAIYRNAYALGLKGCTTYRPGAGRGQVMTADQPPPAKPCCELPGAD